MALITRQGKGSKLTIQEMDDNLIYLETLSGTASALDAVLTAGNLTDGNGIVLSSGDKITNEDLDTSINFVNNLGGSVLRFV